MFLLLVIPLVALRVIDVAVIRHGVLVQLAYWL